MAQSRKKILKCHGVKCTASIEARNKCTSKILQIYGLKCTTENLHRHGTNAQQRFYRVLGLKCTTKNLQRHGTNAQHVSSFSDSKANHFQEMEIISAADFYGPQKRSPPLPTATFTAVSIAVSTPVPPRRFLLHSHRSQQYACVNLFPSLLPPLQPFFVYHHHYPTNHHLHTSTLTTHPNTTATTHLTITNAAATATTNTTHLTTTAITTHQITTVTAAATVIASAQSHRLLC